MSAIQIRFKNNEIHYFHVPIFAIVNDQVIPSVYLHAVELLYVYALLLDISRLKVVFESTLTNVSHVAVIKYKIPENRCCVMHFRFDSLAVAISRILCD